MTNTEERATEEHISADEVYIRVRSGIPVWLDLEADPAFAGEPGVEFEYVEVVDVERADGDHVVLGLQGYGPWRVALDYNLIVVEVREV